MESPSSTISSPPSIFSPSAQSDWSQSTVTSPLPTPSPTYPVEKIDQTPSLALFRPTFTTVASTDLHFTAFPPHDLIQPTSSILGWQSAIRILQEHYTHDIFRHLIGNPAILRRISNLPSSSIHSYIFNSISEKSALDKWEYYAITTSLPVALRRFSSSWKWHLAVRRLANGQEKLFFGPLGMIIRSVFHVQERSPGAAESENAGRQLIYLTETTEVKCPSGLRWWVEKKVSEDVLEIHERFRERWDESVISTWEQMRRRKEAEESLLDEITSLC